MGSTGISRNENNTRAALVLGAAVHAGGQPSAALKRRALQAARLYRGGQIDTVIASGGPPGAAPTEAAVIRSLCRTAGVAVGDILIEDRAKNTEENIVNSLPLLAANGIGEIVLVTDRYHARRAEMVAQAYGLTAHASCPPPIGTGRLRLIKLYAREIAARALFRFRQAYGQ